MSHSSVPAALTMNPPAFSDPISGAEYRERRLAVLAALGTSAGVVLAGERGGDGKFKASAHFVYLTGIRDEPGAAVFFDPTNPNPDRRCVLLLKPLAVELEQWDGLRPPLGQALRAKLGFAAIVRTDQLARLLTDAARRCKSLACLHGFAVYDAPVSPDLVLFRKVMERVPGVGLVDLTEVIPTLRSVKSVAELGTMRKSISATAAGFAAGAKAIRPGASERAVQRAVERAFQDHGASGHAYDPIVGSGVASTVLHWVANDRLLQSGDVLCLDAGATLGGYAADITRTFPVSGQFSKRQRELYDLVLEAELAAIKAVRPGVRMHEVDMAARDVFRRANVEDHYLHGIGHHLGLDVHDATPDLPLRPGMIVTIEPGLYLPHEKIGIRIEDDILVTESGHENLSVEIPKSAEEMERMVSQG